MIYLKKLQYKPKEIVKTFPYNLNIFRDGVELEFNSSITILAGENGSGKSTFLESLALAINSIAIGGNRLSDDYTLKIQREFSRNLKLYWSNTTDRGFFMRSEDFFNFVKLVNSEREENLAELRRIDKEYKGRSNYSITLAKSPYLKALAGLESRYGKDFDAQSHGESFIKLFQNRFVPNGLYLLDEPESPLSPIKQYSLLMVIKDMIENDGAQFIISTHSPILMGYPEAQILSFDDGKISSIDYEDLEHVKFTRDFLNNRERYVRHL